jgi:hypothetical protein
VAIARKFHLTDQTGKDEAAEWRACLDGPEREYGRLEAQRQLVEKCRKESLLGAWIDDLECRSEIDTYDVQVMITKMAAERAKDCEKRIVETHRMERNMREMAINMMVLKRAEYPSCK